MRLSRTSCAAAASTSCASTFCTPRSAAAGPIRCQCCARASRQSWPRSATRRPLMIGGRSMGGRAASMIAADRRPVRRPAAARLSAPSGGQARATARRASAEHNDAGALHQRYPRLVMPARSDGCRVAAPAAKLSDALDRGGGSLLPCVEVVRQDGYRCHGGDRRGDVVMDREPIVLAQMTSFRTLSTASARTNANLADFREPLPLRSSRRASLHDRRAWGHRLHGFHRLHGCSSWHDGLHSNEPGRSLFVNGLGRSRRQCSSGVPFTKQPGSLRAERERARIARATPSRFAPSAARSSCEIRAICVFGDPRLSLHEGRPGEMILTAAVRENPPVSACVCADAVSRTQRQGAATVLWCAARTPRPPAARSRRPRRA